VTHYEALGVSPSASHAEIKRAYRLKVRLHHPDVGGSGGDFIHAVNQAWATLGDPARRQAYDRAIGMGVAAPRSAPPRPAASVDLDDAEDEEMDWGPEPEPGPPAKRDVFLFVPIAFLGCAAFCVGLGGLLYAPVLLGMAVFFLALAGLSFALVPILTLRRQARSTYR